ncbi:MAG TPA: SPOR domain-containing protein [Acidobacteriota bacterium]|nr:SPOR domain-containing protein [Acidobacteriota bacterium]
MSYTKIPVLMVLMVLLGLLIVGCSDKKEEAERLEQEMREVEAGADTAALPAVDTSAETAPADAYAVPKEQAPEPMMPQRPLGSGFTVQVASCEDEDYARYLVGVYGQRGYEPYVVEQTIEGQVYYRVRIGLFATSAEARALKEELKDRFSVEAWVDQD